MALIRSEEQEALVALVKKVAEAEIQPLVADADTAGECPEGLYKWGFDLGLHLVEIPKEYGGLGLSYETSAMLFEELAKVDAGYAVTFAAIFVAWRNVAAAGTPEQKQMFADCIRGRKFSAFALTEPNAGSDVASMHASAVEEERDGNAGYLLNANKVFITNGGIASIYVVFCKTDPDARGRGITAFIVERAREGVRVGATEDKMGLRLSNTTELILEDVWVPEDHVLGQVNGGLKVALNALDISRAYASTIAVGIMQRALDEALVYAREREQFGRPIAKFQQVQTMLADMAIKVEAARCLCDNTMRLVDAGKSVQKEGAIAKTFATDVLQEVVSDAVQIFGGYGYSCEYPVEKLMRDAKIFQIFEGTNQVLRTTIAKCLLDEGK